MAPEGAGRFQALILAAGVGRRLGDEASGGPKALLSLGGRSLMSRHLGILRGLGVARVSVVVGFGSERLAAALDEQVRTILNPDFREGSVVSLWAGREVLRAGDPVLLMDADVLHDRRLLARLLASGREDCALLDREIEPGDEPVKLCLRDGEIVDFHKRPTARHDWHGESVGFFRLSAGSAAELADRAGDYVASGRRGLEYEEPLRDMMIAHPGRFGFEDISGLPWTEIDFPEDVAKAHALLPALAA